MSTRPNTLLLLLEHVDDFELNLFSIGLEGLFLYREL